MEHDGRFTLSVAPTPELVAVARMFSARVARHFECLEEQVQDIKIAISEACSNAVHAHRGAGIHRPIRIIAQPTSEGLSYEIIDVGPGFEFAGTPVRIPHDPGELLGGGLGLALIRALFPDVEIVSNGESGTTVRFSVRAPVTAEHMDLPHG
jgi:serine/threonine-protein kinase RsbW